MELDKHVDLHPFLVSASVDSTGHSHRGRWWDWRVVEKPRVGPVSYRIRFRARVVRTSPTSLESRARALLGCRLRVITRGVASEDGRTVLTESVLATAPLPLVDYVARQARNAHARTYQQLPATLASIGLTPG